jgi:hypothetical protein
VALLLALAGLWAAPEDRIEISVPRSWMLEGERSRCPEVRPSDVIAMLGEPDRIGASGWLERWQYDRLGIWVEWETPRASYCLDRLVPDATAAHVLSPFIPLLWLAKVRLTPRHSLLQVGWSGWGMKAVWNFDNAGPPPVFPD